MALAKMLSAVKKFSFADGETFFYRGKSYPVSASQRLLCFTGELFLLPPGDDAARRAGLEKLYRRLAEQYINEFGKLAKESNTVVVPSNVADVAGFIKAAASTLKKG